jgi:MFS family permease
VLDTAPRTQEPTAFDRQRVAILALVCGLSQSSIVLEVARGVQGLGGAVISPAALSILLVTFPEGAARNRALAVWGAAVVSLLTISRTIGRVAQVPSAVPPESRLPEAPPVMARPATPASAIAACALCSPVTRHAVIAQTATGWSDFQNARSTPAEEKETV